jgi:hypothetical protein
MSAFPVFGRRTNLGFTLAFRISKQNGSTTNGEGAVFIAFDSSPGNINISPVINNSTGVLSIRNMFNGGVAGTPVLASVNNKISTDANVLNSVIMVVQTNANASTISCTYYVNNTSGETISASNSNGGSGYNDITPLEISIGNRSSGGSFFSGSNTISFLQHVHIYDRPLTNPTDIQNLMNYMNGTGGSVPSGAYLSMDPSMLAPSLGARNTRAEGRFSAGFVGSGTLAYYVNSWGNFTQSGGQYGDDPAWVPSKSAFFYQAGGTRMRYIPPPVTAASAITAGSLGTFISSSTASTTALALDVRGAIKAMATGAAKNSAKSTYISSLRTKLSSTKFTVSNTGTNFQDYLATFDASAASLSAKDIDVFLPDASNVIDISSAASTNYSALEMPIGTPVTINDGSTTLGTLTYDGTIYTDNTGRTYSVGNTIIFGTKQITVLGRGSVLATIANTYTSVEVNLNVVITADGELQLLSQQFTTPDNVVVATQTLPANCLYDVTSAPSNPLGLIEFWEPTGVDDIECQLATSYKTSANVEAYKVIAGKLVKGLQDVLVGNLDATNAAPFSNYVASGIEGNYKMIGFGRLALMSYAHYIMGHVQATAAITNDTAFIRSMLSLDANDAYRYTVTNGSVGDYNASATSGVWVDAGDKTNANLAARLVKTLITNNASSSVTSNPGATSVANIVKQVIGQDASRARGEDNSKYLPDNKGLLRFYAGDKIYVAISLEVPTVSVTSGQLVDQNTLQPLYTPTVAQKKYNLKITLS